MSLMPSLQSIIKVSAISVKGSLMVKNHSSLSQHSQSYCLRKYNRRLISENFRRYITQNFDDICQSSFKTIDQESVKSVFTKQGLSVHDGYTCIITHCKSHQENSVFVNKTTGHYTCFNCKSSGPWHELEAKLRSHCTSQSKDNHESILCPEWENVHQTTVPFNRLSEKLQQEISISSNIGKLSKSLLTKLNMLADPQSKSLYLPLKNFAGTVVGYKQLCKNEETTYPNKHCTGLIQYAPLKKKTEAAVLVHRMVDFLALCNSHLNYNIVCLPNGLTCLPQEILPCLEEYNKLYLWFGKDHESTRVFSTKLNRKRCYLIRESDSQPLPAESKVKSLDLSRIIETAAPIDHPAIITYDMLQQDILADLQNNDQVQGVKWKRFPTLSRILGGHRRGELTILTGGTGCGKTTLMSEYSLDLALQGVTTLWGSFEVQNKRLARIMLQQLIRKPLLENLDKFNDYSERFKTLPMYFLTFHGPQPLKLVMEAVEHAMYVYDTSHVIIDNVQFMLGLSDSALDRFYMQDTIIQSFRAFATRSHCHVTLVIHPRKENEQLTINSVFGSAKATQESDNVLIIQQKFNQNLELKKFLQVAKNRFSGDLGLMPLEFNKSNLSFEEKQSKTSQMHKTVAPS